MYPEWKMYTLVALIFFYQGSYEDKSILVQDFIMVESLQLFTSFNDN